MESAASAGVDECVVVVEMEEPTSTEEHQVPEEELVFEKELKSEENPTHEEKQASDDDELKDNKLLTVIFEEENCQDNNDVEQPVIENRNIGEVNDKNPESPSKNEETNSSMNKTRDKITQLVNPSQKPEEEVNELNRKRSQESSNKAAEEEKIQEENLDRYKRKKVELFTDIKGPEWYNVKGNLVTRSILPKNLTKQFEFLPIFGRPDNGDMEEFHQEKIREFIGPDINDDEFEELSKYCSPDNLRTGKELVVNSTMPSQGILSADDATQLDNVKANLCILKKCRMRIEKDKANNYSTKLKYRGVRLIPLSQDEDKELLSPVSDDVMLEPGKDMLFRIRLYRPYYYQITKERFTRGRHSVFSCDMVAPGRLRLSGVRDRIVCTNDLDMRLDVAAAPHAVPATTAKEVFPSGFLFINNTFYVDTRPGCKDQSRVIREWAVRRGLGEYPVKDMHAVRLEDIAVKLGYPEVYVHQGNCEHVFTFSEIRLLSSSDPLRLSAYPRHTAVSQHQTVYCTTCAEFGAKWVVVGCPRVPFDPAFFCDTCFKQYLYIDGVKIGDFKAYSYRGNETYTLRPC